MVQGILGRKIGMTQVYRDTGELVAATAIQAGPCVVTQVKNEQKDGYTAIQIGFDEGKRLNKPEKGHLESLPALAHLREFAVDEPTSYSRGDRLDIGFLKPGNLVNVIGISKGRGFAGVVKRHHFGGGPKTHGQSDRHRAPGAIGATTSPGRVLKGQRMAGHMGHRKTTARHLEVIGVDAERNLLLVRGAVPGARGGLVTIEKVEG
ncbi:MAG: 50S ribosomal protein L3 [Chloroflexota bacterium]